MPRPRGCDLCPRTLEAFSPGSVHADGHCPVADVLSRVTRPLPIDRLWRVLGQPRSLYLGLAPSLTVLQETARDSVTLAGELSLLLLRGLGAYVGCISAVLSLVGGAGTASSAFSAPSY